MGEVAGRGFKMGEFAGFKEREPGSWVISNFIAAQSVGSIDS